MKLILVILAMTLNFAIATDQPRLWAECCKIHDLYFWAGGKRDHRQQADKDLRSCVEEKGGGLHANLIYLGVTIGGVSPWKIHGKQWGNAWGNKVRKSKLAEDEIDLLETDLNKNSDLSLQEINDFIADLRGKNIN
jgi:hypothetical protein